MRKYEVIFILRPDVVDEEADKLVAGLESAATHAGAKLNKIDRLGKHRLAYRVHGFREGNYVLFEMESGAEAVRELQRRLRVTEPVIKFMAVRMDEMEKRLDKDRKRREARIKRRPAAPVAEPSMEAEMSASVAEDAPPQA